MLPIKIKNQNFLISDASLFTLVDEETQTSKCVSEQGSSAIDIKHPHTDLIIESPDATEQEVANLLDYCKILSETEVFNTKVHIENIKQHKQGGISAKSSHGTFLFGNIFQREDRVEPQLTRSSAWKLDESFDIEFPNSGYIYIPCADTEANKEDVSNKACVFIPNQPTCLVSENNEEDILKSNPVKQASFHSKISKERISARVGFTSIPIEEVNIDAKDSKIEMANKKASNEDVCPSPSELAARRLNYIAQEIKSHLSTTLSVIMDPICDGACRSKRLKMEEVKAKEKIVEVVKQDPSEVEPKLGIVSRIKKSWSNLVCGPCPSCEAKLASQKEQGQKDDPPKSEHPPEEKKEEEKQPCSPNKLCGPVITYPCPPPRPRNCGFDEESAHSLEFKETLPLINEMSPNNEFVSEEYIFSNNDHPSSIILMSTDKNEHDAISKPIFEVFDLSAVASSIKDDDYIHSKAENISMIKDTTVGEARIQKTEHSGPIAKIIDVVESTVASLKEHIDLDRISCFNKDVTKSQDKAEESRAPSSEYFIRAVAPEAITQSHQFIPPSRSLFTSFKSTIFRFFGDRKKMEEMSDISSSSETSSEMSDDSTNDESN